MQADSTIPLRPQTKNILGSTFHRLTVIAFAGYHRRQAFWMCRCICGSERPYAASNLGCPSLRSCGCLKLEKAAARLTTHGKARLPEYRVWYSMRQRCSNPHDKGYPNYGGRGIIVCDRWASFANFYADMGPRPPSTPGAKRATYSIERRINTEGYTPTNCYWALQCIQQRNKRTNIMITHNGTTQCMTDWILQQNISTHLVYDRLKKGWTIDEALFLPPRQWRRKTTSLLEASAHGEDMPS